MSPDEAFAELPPAVLLLGPAAWEAGQKLYEQHESSFSTRVEKLDALLARYIVGQAYIRPVGRALRVFLVNLDGASEESLNALLKVLEEPPSAVRFILAATVAPLRTIVSRCQVLILGEPEPDQVAGEHPARSAVGVAARAARDGQADVLETVMRNWDDSYTMVLRAWAAERAADRWVEFDEDFVPGVTVRQAMVILSVLRAYSGARTAPYVALGKAFSAER